MEYRRRRHKKTFFTKKKIIILSISIAVFTLISVMAISLNGLFTGYDGTDGIHEKVDELVEVKKGTGKITFLMVGVDKVAGATDTIIVGCWDKDKDEVNMMSIPRDTRMYIGNKYQKINSAYNLRSKGVKRGINGTVEAVSRLTGIPINYYIEFSVSGIDDMFEVLGPVEFDVPDVEGKGRGMNYDDPEQNLHIHLKPGIQKLSGNQIQQFLRYRKSNYGVGTGSDTDRVKRQQDFIKAMAEQKLNAGIIAELPDMFKVVKDNMKTNLTLNDVVRYSTDLADLSAENINMFCLPGKVNDTNYGGSYWIADMDETKKIVEEIFGYDAEDATIHRDKSVKEEPVSSSPKTTVKPAKTDKPTKTIEPNETDEPDETDKPTKSEKPDSSKEPDGTEKPKTTKKPTKTVKPKETKKPSPSTVTTETPKPKDEEESTEVSETTDTPSETTKNTEKPVSTQQITDAGQDE